VGSMITTLHTYRKQVAKLALAVLVASTLLPGSVSAAQITGRKLTLSTSSPAAGATVTYAFDFTVPTTGTIIQSWAAQICTTASGACTMPTGFVNSSSISQPTGLGDASGWTGNTATAGSLRMSKSGNATTPSGAQTVVFNNVTNPTTANQTFYARITTYSDASWTTAIDTGTVAAATATQIQLTGVMDESLVFCVGTSITGQDCSTIAGGTINFGTFSSLSTSSGTSVMAASTNAQSGYSITISGATLTSNSNTIRAATTQEASQTGVVAGQSQFGLNLRANTVPSVGSDVTGTGVGAAAANYAAANQFRFVSGDVVAAASEESNANAFTSSYIVNVEGKQAAGTYTATMTYICTATF
jgi:hypothetical protein